MSADAKLPIEEEKSGKILLDIREFKLKYRLSLGKISRFFEELEKGSLYATKCEKCGRIYFPPQADCPYCRTSNLSWVKLSGKGKLLTYAVINVKPTTFSHYDDYIIGICELDEGVRVFTWVRVDDVSKLSPGMRVEVKVVKREPEGYPIFECVPIV